MCMLCVEIAKGKLTYPEAKKALIEMMETDDPDTLEHLYEILIEIKGNLKNDQDT